MVGEGGIVHVNWPTFKKNLNTSKFEVEVFCLNFCKYDKFSCTYPYQLKSKIDDAKK